MHPITTEMFITGNCKLNLNIDLPEDCPLGKAMATVTYVMRLLLGTHTL